MILPNLGGEGWFESTGRSISIRESAGLFVEQTETATLALSQWDTSRGQPGVDSIWDGARGEFDQNRRILDDLVCDTSTFRHSHSLI